MSLDGINRAILRACASGDITAETLIEALGAERVAEALGVEAMLRACAKQTPAVWLLAHTWRRGESVTCVFATIEDARRALRLELTTELRESLGPSVTIPHDCVTACAVCQDAQGELDSALAIVYGSSDENLLSMWEESFSRVMDSWWDVVETTLNIMEGT